MSYQALLDAAVLHGNSLKSRLKPGAKCAILCDTGLHTAIGILACWAAGLTAIPLSKNYGKEHCAKILNCTEPDILFTDNSNCTFKYTYHLVSKAFTGNLGSIQPDPTLSDVALIMCTSGTTGMPKGSMITKKALQKNVQAVAQYFSIGQTDTILIARPLYHCAVLTGEFLIALSKGVQIAFFNDAYNPVNVISSIKKYSATTICGTPTLLGHIARLIKPDRENSIRKIAVSGECLSESGAKKIRSAFPDAEIYSVYGLTEASPRVSYLPPSDFDRFPESVGIPIEGAAIKILDTQMKTELPANVPGIVMVSSPCLMKGYYREPALTEKTVKDGWLNTRDMGYKDEKGYLYILGRADDMLIKAGMNIYPREIENPVRGLPEVAECMAYGKERASGQEIILDVVLQKDYKDIRKKEFARKLGMVLPSYLMPAEVRIVDTIPRNASGKLVRNRREGYGTQNDEI